VAVFAIDGQVADDDPAPQARAKRQHDNAVILLAAADPKFAVSRGVGVVGERRGQAEGAGHFIANREIVPVRQIVRLEEHAARDVHGPGRTKADGCDVADRQANTCQHLINRRPGAFYRVARPALLFGRNLGMRE
jgi:hypothetical protein